MSQQGSQIPRESPVRKSQSYELDDAPSQDREAPASSSKPPTIPDSSFWGQMPHCHPPLIGVFEFDTSKRPFLGVESMAGVHGARRQRRSVLLRWILVSSLALTLSVLAAVPVGASGVNISGGGSTDTMTRFALGIHDGRGHFECLMPALMTVEATVTSASVTGTGRATFSGTAVITLAKGNPFGLPAGPSPFGRVSFTASVAAGGPGIGFEDLHFPTFTPPMDFPGTVEQGHISIGS